MTERAPLHWPRHAPPPLTRARLRANPEDFLVEEIMPHTPCGSGEHLWLQVRKRGFNTEQVALALARAAGVTRREVSYAGLKDRHAITVQWFSLQLPGRADPVWPALPEGIEILAATRHNRKLKTGALGGNCFTVTLRACVGDTAAVQTRLDQIRDQGVPNYFGEQRFGHGGANLTHARALFAGTETVRDRHRRGLYLSAARSFLFNEVLAARVRDHSWSAILPGEACLLAGSRSFFVTEAVDDTIARRLAEHDIHPSGPLWGRGELPSRANAQVLEREIATQHPDLAQGLAAAGLEQERRALRLIPKELTAEALDSETWRLRFCLPPGCYATALVQELADYQITDAQLLGDEPP